MGLEAKYVVKLTVEERSELQSMLDEGRNSMSVRQRAEKNKLKPHLKNQWAVAL